MMNRNGKKSSPGWCHSCRPIPDSTDVGTRKKPLNLRFERSSASEQSETSTISLVSFNSSPALGYLGQDLYRRPYKLGFDAKASADELKQLRYDPLRDPNLLDYLSKPRTLRRLIRLGLISPDGRVKTSKRMLSEYRTKYLHRLAVLLAQKKIENEDLDRAATFEQRRQLQLAILKEEYRQRAKRYKRHMEKKRREARAARRRYRKSLRDYDEMSDDDYKRKQKRVIREAFRAHLDTKKYLTTKPKHDQRDRYVEGTRKIEELKEHSHRAPFVPSPRTRQEVKKHKRRKRKKSKTTTPLEHDVFLSKKLNERKKKRKKINLAKLIKRLHMQPKYKVYASKSHSGSEQHVSRRRKKTSKRIPTSSQSIHHHHRGKLSTLQGICHDVQSLGDIIDDYLSKAEDVRHLETLENSYEEVDESKHLADYGFEDYDVRKHHSGRAAIVVEPVSVSSLSLDTVDSEDELDSDARYYYVPHGNTTLSPPTREELVLAEVRSTPEARTPSEYDYHHTVRSVNAETQTESVFSSEDDDSSDGPGELTGTFPRRSSESTRAPSRGNSLVVSTTPGDSGIQTSKEMLEQRSGTICGAQAGVVKSDDTQIEQTLSRQPGTQCRSTSIIGTYSHGKSRSRSKSKADQMMSSLQSTLTLESSRGRLDTRNGMSDIKIVRLGSRPLRQVTEILSNLADSLYHMQSSKESVKSDTDVVTVDSQPLTDVRRALSSLSSFLSLQIVESEPLSELYRAVSQLFKLYSVKFARSGSTLSTQSATEGQSRVPSSDDIKVALDRAEQGDLQRIASDLFEACRSTDSLSSTITSDRLLDILEQLKAEDIHLEESDILLNLIECVIDHIETLVPGQTTVVDKVYESEEVIIENNMVPKDTFEVVAIMIQETLDNVADELMRIADYLETDQLTQAHVSAPHYVSSSQFGFDDTITTPSMSTEWTSIKRLETATQTPRDSQNRYSKFLQNVKTETKDNGSKSLPALLKIGEVSQSNFTTGIGARPKVPSKMKVKSTASTEPSDQKRTHGSPSKRRNSDSKYKSSSRVSRRHSSGKVDILSSTSGSTVSIYSNKSCDVYSSASQENKRRSSRRRKPKRRNVKIQVEKYEGTSERLDKKRRHAEKCADKFAQKPSIPDLFVDKGSSAIDFSRLPQLPISIQSDIVQTVITEIITNMKESLTRSTERREKEREVFHGTAKYSPEDTPHTRSEVTSSEASIRDKGPNEGSSSHVSMVVKQILRECQDSLRQAHKRSSEKEISKSTDEVRGKPDSRAKYTQKTRDMEVKSEILSSLISEIMEGIALKMSEVHEKESGPKEKRGFQEVCSAEDNRPRAQDSVAEKESFDSLSKAMSVSREQFESASSSKPSISNNLSRFLSDLLDSWRKISKRSSSSYQKMSKVESSESEREVEHETSAEQMKDKTSANEKLDLEAERCYTDSQGDLKTIFSEAYEQLVTDLILKTTQETDTRVSTNQRPSKDDLMRKLVQTISEVICQQKLEKHTRSAEDPQRTKTLSGEIEVDRGTKSFPVMERMVTEKLASADEIKDKSTQHQLARQQVSLLRTAKNEPLCEDTVKEGAEGREERLPAPISLSALSHVIDQVLQQVHGKIGSTEADESIGETDLVKHQVALDKTPAKSNRSRTQTAQIDVPHSRSTSSGVLQYVISDLIRKVAIDSYQQRVESVSSSVVQTKQSGETSKKKETVVTPSKIVYKVISEIVNASITEKLMEVTSFHKREARLKATMQSPRSLSSETVQHRTMSVTQRPSETQETSANQSFSVSAEGISKGRTPEAVRSLSSGVIQQIVADVVQAVATSRSTTEMHAENMVSRETADTRHEQEINGSDDIITSSSSDIIENIICDLLRASPGKEAGHATLPRAADPYSVLRQSRKSDQMMVDGADETEEGSDRKVSHISLRSLSSERIEHLISDVLNVIAKDETIQYKSLKSLSPDDVKRRGSKLLETSSRIDQENKPKKAASVKSISSDVIDHTVANILRKTVNTIKKKNLQEEISEKSRMKPAGDKAKLCRRDDDDTLKKELVTSTASDLVQGVISDILKSKVKDIEESTKSVKEIHKPSESAREEKYDQADLIRSLSSNVMRGIVSDVLTRAQNDVQNLEVGTKSMSSAKQQVSDVDSDVLLMKNSDVNSDDTAMKGVLSEIIHKLLLNTLQTATREHTTCDLEDHSETIELEHIIPDVPTDTKELKDRLDSALGAQQTISTLLDESSENAEQQTGNSLRHFRSLSSDAIQDLIDNVLHIEQQKVFSVGGRRASCATVEQTRRSSSIIQKIIQDVLETQRKMEAKKGPRMKSKEHRVSTEPSTSDANSENIKCCESLPVESVSSDVIERMITDTLRTIAEQGTKAHREIPVTLSGVKSSEDENLSLTSSSSGAINQLIWDLLVNAAETKEDTKLNIPRRHEGKDDEETAIHNIPVSTVSSAGIQQVVSDLLFSIAHDQKEKEKVEKERCQLDDVDKSMSSQAIERIISDILRQSASGEERISHSDALIHSIVNDVLQALSYENKGDLKCAKSSLQETSKIVVEADRKEEDSSAPADIPATLSSSDILQKIIVEILANVSTHDVFEKPDGRFPLD